MYRTYEAIMHYGEAIKHIINEEAGDGIMSAIDFFLTVGTVKGKLGETRVVITFNGKFLPHIEQVRCNPRPLSTPLNVPLQHVHASQSRRRPGDSGSTHAQPG